MFDGPEFQRVLTLWACIFIGLSVLVGVLIGWVVF